MNCVPRRPAARPCWWMLGLAALQLAACSKSTPPPPPPPPEVTVIKTEAQPVTVYRDYVAQTEAVDRVEIRSRVGGILERQAYVDGARVKQDDLLFVIDQQPYITALAQAKAAQAQAQASYINSKQTLARIRPLLAKEAVSAQDADAATAKEQADAASVEAARAAVKQAELNLGYTSIRASRDGAVSKALIKPGGLVTAAQTLLTTLYSADPMHVTFTLSEARLLELQTRFKGNLAERDRKEAPPFKLMLVDGSEYKFPGKLDFIDAAVNPSSGTLQVRLAVPNPDRMLLPGQFVRVVVAGAQLPEAIRVPQRAVLELQGKRSVYVVGADNKVESREVVANSRLANDWAIEGGLKPGEMVIVDGIQKTRPGAMVKPVAEGPKPPAAATPAATKTDDAAGAKKAGS